MSTNIDIIKILQILLRRLWIIIVFVVIFAAMLLSYSKYFLEPTYTAVTKMYVSVEDQQSTLNGIYDPTKVAVKLVDSCLYILKSDTVISKVVKQTGLSYTTAEIERMISVTRIKDTEFFTVNVTTNNPQHAKLIADEIGKIAPDEIVKFYKTGTIEVLDEPKLPTTPSGPNIQKNTLFGALIGFGISILLIFIIEMFSTTVKTEQDLIDAFNLPVLGSIPEFDSAATNSNNKKKKKHGRRYGYYYSK